MKTAELLLREIKEGKITSPEELELRKIRLAKGDLIKNSEIAGLVSKNDQDYDKIRKLLRIKNVRTASGVANIAVMWKYKSHEYSCPAKCIYCPQGTETDAEGVIRLNSPKSYTGVEPTTLRAIRNDYDPFLQVSNRIKQLNIIGHTTDKCELIVMGGTFTATDYRFQENFIKHCLDGFNEAESKTLEEAESVNEKAANRCIGMTIETRADYCSDAQIDHMLKMGCTRVEIGVQSIDNELLALTKRGHDAKANVEAIRRLKEKGLKVCLHWMPGLTGLYGKIDESKEIEMFSKLFSEGYSPDEIKIYPTLVIPGTELHRLWKEGKYTPLTEDQMIRLLIEFKKVVPEYVRIKRVMRDISEHKPEAGAKTTNLRQLAKLAGAFCKCIRCREVEHTGIRPQNIELKKLEYDASGGKEIFLSYEGEGSLIGFLRLRLDSTQTARIRELHVYGKMVQIGSRDDAPQHTGTGKKLMAEAERIAKEHNKTKITVTSGIGVREYYKKLGYVFETPYMIKYL